ncbi:regulatory protein SipA [Lyngbya confervoides]|uniref:DUF3148 domain-containing protein n=1 Tax=Lyngbya confervoides BDU141951 TaxID=1574623 RepID=A0ABD4T935_9CYAN|nr:DUF3148 domain-containing protein [Lyngbya confervoides]MCM1985293.1 DUF3148 domain-containing protein [Lyngbya confervoides BDU141951]
MADELTTGDRVRLIALPAYVKTAEPMPMLRPPTVLSLGEEGVILGRQPGNEWSIRFKKGAYLLQGDYVERIDAEPVDSYSAGESP